MLLVCMLCVCLSLCVSLVFYYTTELRQSVFSFLLLILFFSLFLFLSCSLSLPLPSFLLFPSSGVDLLLSYSRLLRSLLSVCSPDTETQTHDTQTDTDTDTQGHSVSCLC